MQILKYRQTYSIAGDESEKKIFCMKDLWSFQPSYVILNKMWQKCYIIAVATLLEFGIIHLDDQTEQVLNEWHFFLFFEHYSNTRLNVFQESM